VDTKVYLDVLFYEIERHLIIFFTDFDNFDKASYKQVIQNRQQN